jgi:hypothetical protein
MKALERENRELKREPFEVARCTVERLMQALGQQGAVRGRLCQTTVSNDAAIRPVAAAVHGDATQSAVHSRSVVK